MGDFETVDFFTDQSLIPDPYPYFDHLRSTCPVLPGSSRGVVAVTGHEEALAVYKDTAFSACVSVAGPFSGLPFEPDGDDIGARLFPPIGDIRGELVVEPLQRIVRAAHRIVLDGAHQLAREHRVELFVILDRDSE